MDHEKEIMMLIVHSGDARSKALEAVYKAKAEQFEEARKKLDEAEAAITEAHKQQTDILQLSFEDPNTPVGMFMIHAQDHLMNAITVVDMAREMCEMYQMILEKMKRFEAAL